MGILLYMNNNSINFYSMLVENSSYCLHQNNLQNK